MKKIMLYFLAATLIASIAFVACEKESGTGRETIVMDVTGNYIVFDIAGIGTITLNWGDQTTPEQFTMTANAVRYSHIYASDEEHTVTITGTVTFLHGNNNITSIDVSKNNMLTYLYCSGNFTSLDVGKCKALKELCCLGYLTSLDASKCISLTELNCRNNNLTSIDVSECSKLKFLDCGSSYHVTGNRNKLTHLDVSKCTVLQRLNCNNNDFSADALNALFETLHSNMFEGKRIYMGFNPGTSDCDPQIAEKKGWLVLDSK
jgi:hypothetical protein